METAEQRALKESEISGTSEAVCFIKGWRAAISAASSTAHEVGDSMKENLIGNMIADAIRSLKD